MTQFKQFSLSLPYAFILSIGKNEYKQRLPSISTVSTAVTLEVYKEGTVLFDCLTGLDYMEQAFLNKDVHVNETQDLIKIRFTDEDLEIIEDRLDIVDDPIISKAHIFLHEYQIVGFNISKELVNEFDQRIEYIDIQEK